MVWFFAFLGLCVSLIVLLQCFFLVGYVMETPVGKRRQKRLMQVLKDITRVLKREKIPYFIDFGTALGHVREGGIILDDIDVDLGVKITNTAQEDYLLEVLQRELSSDYYIQKKRELIQMYPYAHVNDSCDLYFYRPVPDKPGFLKYSLITCHEDTIYPTQAQRFNNTFRVEVPRDSQTFLRDRYGETWHIPRPWDKGVDDDDPWRTPAFILRPLMTWRELLHIPKKVIV